MWKRIVSGAVVVGVGLAGIAVAGAVSGESDTEVVAPKLALDLTLLTPAVPAGEYAQFEVHLRNEGDAPARVVLPGDGSEVGWRTPVARWEPEIDPMRMCGNINPLTADEIVTLAPGERVSLEWVRYRMMQDAGVHTVSLTLEHDPAHEWGGLPLGNHNSTAMEQVRAIPPFEVTSNPVEVTVR